MDETQKLSNLFHGLTILQHCGSGTFGDVYYCHDASHVNMVVKKIPRKKLGDEWKRELKGLRNYQKVARKNPTLLQVYHAADDDDEFLYYTMEAADNIGKPGQGYVPDLLGTRLEDGGLDCEEVLNVAEDLIKGLQIMHKEGLFHRDVKPMNVVFVDGKAKLGDIGLVSNAGAMMTSLVGTIEFIPPEILTGAKPASSVSCEGDVYALGKVIYCSFTGNTPDEFPSLPENLSIKENWVKQLTHLVMKLCDKDPDSRISDIDDAAQLVAETRSRIASGKTVSQGGLKETFSAPMQQIGPGKTKILLGGLIGIILLCCLIIAHKMDFSGSAILGGAIPDAPKPVLHYTFDQNTKNSGILGPSHDGISYGATFSDDAKIGNASMAMGKDGYVWSPALSFGNIATVATWIKGDFTSPVQVLPRDCMNTVFSTRTETRSPGGLLFCINQWKAQDCSVKLESGIPVASKTTGTGPGVLTSNNWHHLALTIDRSAGKVRIYVDGVLKKTGEGKGFTKNFSDNQPVFIGAPGKLVWWHFRGKIDDFRVYNHLLSDQQIKDLATP